jgi:hypothetical protein
MVLRQDFFEEFCREFAKEMNRLRMEQRVGLTSAKREVERIGRRIKKLLDLLLDDEVDMDEGKAEIKALDARRKELEIQLKAADEPPPLLHPAMADLYRTKIEELSSALQREDTRLEASEMIRLIDSIVLIPDEGQTPDRAERQSGRDVDCCPTNEKVARNGRPSRAGTNGCGGPQPSIGPRHPDRSLRGGRMNGVRTIKVLGSRQATVPVRAGKGAG